MLTPIEFFITYLENIKNERCYGDFLRKPGNDGYEYTLIGALSDSYLLYRDFYKQYTRCSWESNVFKTDKKNYTKKIPGVVINWIISDCRNGHNIVNYIYAMNYYVMSFRQFAQLLKMQL